MRGTQLFLVNLAGPWQVMLKQADGSFACVAESANRFTLGEVNCSPQKYFGVLGNWFCVIRSLSELMHCLACQTKEELLRVLGLQEEEGSSLEFLRRGYKVVSCSLFLPFLHSPPLCRPFFMCTLSILAFPSYHWNVKSFLHLKVMKLYIYSLLMHIGSDIADCHLVGRRCWIRIVFWMA